MHLKSNELDQAFTCNICDETKCHYSNAFINIFTMQKTSTVRIKGCNLGSSMNMSDQNNTQKLTLVAFYTCLFWLSFANRDGSWCADKQDPWPPFEAVAWFQSQILPALQN